MRGEMDWWVRGGWGRWVAFVVGAICMAAPMAAANVVLIGRNVSKSFDDVEANFASAIKGSGECGILFIAEPLDACSLLTNKVVEGSKSPFVLIIRGGCTFDEKVRNAQNAGFKAAIVYDNQDSDSLIAMAGTPTGIHIPAVFVSRASGETLRKYAGCADVELWIIPVVENSAWSIMTISFISLLAMSAVLATCFFACRHRERREQPRASNAREFHGMSRRLVKAMPSLIFTSVLEDNCTSQTCAICLEDYNVGDKLRVLPCCHKFHAFCVDSWLTSWRTFCPVCKRDARTSTGDPPASESTPLLSSAASSPFSSFHSPISVSHATQIVPRLPQSPSSPRIHSSSSCYVPNSHGSYNNSPALIISRSSADLRHASSQRSRASHLMSPHSAGPLLSPPFNSMYASTYIPSSGNASPSYLLGSSSQHSYLRNQNETGSLGYLAGSSSRHSYLRNHNETGSPSYLAGSSSRHLYVTDCTESGSPNYLGGSSSRQSYLRHCSESERSLSALASAQSLPGC